MQITLPGRKRRILICRRLRARTLVATDQPLFLSNRTSPMTAQGHLLFSVTCVLLAHKVELTPALADASLWHIVPMALASALLPDLDHPRSLLGRQLPWISGPLSRLFGHRGFTHSLLAVFGLLTLFYLKVPESWIVPAGRWGLPVDLQGPVVFLASAASDYVNGHTLAVDGGWLAR